MSHRAWHGGYCPCAGLCHRRKSPCSFGCIVHHTKLRWAQWMAEVGDRARLAPSGTAVEFDGVELGDDPWDLRVSPLGAGPGDSMQGGATTAGGDGPPGRFSGSPASGPPASASKRGPT